jgi:hypothetical protein
MALGSLALLFSECLDCLVDRNDLLPFRLCPGTTDSNAFDDPWDSFLKGRTLETCPFISTQIATVGTMARASLIVVIQPNPVAGVSCLDPKARRWQQVFFSVPARRQSERLRSGFSTRQLSCRHPRGLRITVPRDGIVVHILWRFTGVPMDRMPVPLRRQRGRY